MYVWGGRLQRPLFRIGMDRPSWAGDSVPVPNTPVVSLQTLEEAKRRRGRMFSEGMWIRKAKRWSSLKVSCFVLVTHVRICHLLKAFVVWALSLPGTWTIGKSDGTLCNGSFCSWRCLWNASVLWTVGSWMCQSSPCSSPCGRWREWLHVGNVAGEGKRDDVK